MNIVTKAAITALSIVALTFGGAPAANAGKPATTSAITITLDADGTSFPVVAAASDWSKNTGITVVAGDCTGANCIHFKSIVNAIPCDYHVFVNGCAYPLADGSCQVEIYESVVGRANLAALITKHEAGHCIFWYGGLAVSYHLPEDPHALMSATHSGSPSKKEANLTNIDRTFTRSLFG